MFISPVSMPMDIAASSFVSSDGKLVDKMRAFTATLKIENE